MKPVTVPSLVTVSCAGVALLDDAPKIMPVEWVDVGLYPADNVPSTVPDDEMLVFCGPPRSIFR